MAITKINEEELQETIEANRIISKKDLKELKQSLKAELDKVNELLAMFE